MNKVQLRNTRNMHPIQNRILALSNVPAYYSKEYCDAVLYCNIFLKKFVWHKTYVIVLGNMIKGAVCPNPWCNEEWYEEGLLYVKISLGICLILICITWSFHHDLCFKILSFKLNISISPLITVFLSLYILVHPITLLKNVN